MTKEITLVGYNLVENMIWASFEGGYSAGCNGELSPQMKEKAIKAKEELTSYIQQLEARVYRTNGLAWSDVANLCT